MEGKEAITTVRFYCASKLLAVGTLMKCYANTCGGRALHCAHVYIQSGSLSTKDEDVGLLKWPQLLYLLMCAHTCSLVPFKEEAAERAVPNVGFQTPGEW